MRRHHLNGEEGVRDWEHAPDRSSLEKKPAILHARHITSHHIGALGVCVCGFAVVGLHGGRVLDVLSRETVSVMRCLRAVGTQV